MKGTMKSETKRIIFSAVISLLVVALTLLLGFLTPAFIDKELHRSIIASMAPVAGFMILIVVVIEFAAKFFDKTATWPTFFLALALALMFFLSGDQRTVIFYVFDYTFTENAILIINGVGFTAYCLGLIAFVLFQKNDYRIPLSKVEAAGSISVLAGCFVAYFPLAPFSYQFIPFAVTAILAVVWEAKATYATKKNGRSTWVFTISTILLFCVLAMETCQIARECADPTVFVGAGWSSLFCLFAVICFLLIYLIFVVATTRKAAVAEANERKLKELQSSVLREQIKPHFMFNVLNSIKSMCQEDPEKASKAIDLFSRYMRSLTEAGDVYSVPFSKELELIYGYLELEELRRGHPIQTVFNVESFDQEVPYFGIEPLVENAIVHSGVAETEDGQIIIAGYEKGDRYVIEVSDNGRGFDIEKMNPRSIGIRNAKERFRLLFGASFAVESKQGQGTTIHIEIPRKGESA